MPYRFHNDWRALAATIYDRPRDGRVYGNMEFDVTDTMAYIDKRSKEGEAEYCAFCYCRYCAVWRATRRP